MDIVKRFKELGSKFYSKNMGYQPGNDELNDLINEINKYLPENAEIQNMTVNERKKVARQLMKSESVSEIEPKLTGKLVDAQKRNLINTTITSMAMIPGKYTQDKLDHFRSYLETLTYDEIDSAYGGLY